MYIFLCALGEPGRLCWAYSFGKSAELFKGRKVSIGINAAGFHIKAIDFSYDSLFRKSSRFLTPPNIFIILAKNSLKACIKQQINVDPASIPAEPRRLGYPDGRGSGRHSRSRRWMSLPSPHSAAYLPEASSWATKCNRGGYCRFAFQKTSVQIIYEQLERSCKPSTLGRFIYQTSPAQQGSLSNLQAQS